MLSRGQAAGRHSGLGECLRGFIPEQIREGVEMKGPGDELAGTQVLHGLEFIISFEPSSPSRGASLPSSSSAAELVHIEGRQATDRRQGIQMMEVEPLMP